jgi:hypothetical protein
MNMLGDLNLVSLANDPSPIAEKHQLRSQVMAS